MTFLSNVMTDQGVEGNPKKVEAVNIWPKPLTPTDINSFISFANYYRRFGEGFSTIAAPLTALMKKKVKFEWSKNVRRAFKISKTASLQTRLLHCRGVVQYMCCTVMLPE